MIKYGPLTDEERKELAQSIEEVLEHFDPNISALDSMDEPNLYAARVANRYEKTLQAKDATIAALVKACNTFVKAHKISHYLCEASEIRVSGQSYEEFKAAIKEATE